MNLGDYAVMLTSLHNEFSCIFLCFCVYYLRIDGQSNALNIIITLYMYNLHMRSQLCDSFFNLKKKKKKRETRKFMLEFVAPSGRVRVICNNYCKQNKTKQKIR